jgi:hypothetical protein
MADFDVEKYQELIKEKKEASRSQGGGFNRDEFLGNLLNSLETKQINEAVQKVGAVTERSDQIAGAVTKNGETFTQQSQPRPQQMNETQSRTQAGFTDIDIGPDGNIVSRNNPVGQYGNNREEQLYNRIAESSNELARRYNSSGLINEYNKSGGNPAPTQSYVPQNLNEQIEKTVVGILSESMKEIANSALKNAIFESYQTERVANVIKEGIQENKGLIKKIVVETILQLQKRNQNKS